MLTVAFMNNPVTQVAIAEIAIGAFLIVAVPPVRHSRIALIGLEPISKSRMKHNCL